MFSSFISNIILNKLETHAIDNALGRRNSLLVHPYLVDPYLGRNKKGKKENESYIISCNLTAKFVYPSH